MDDAIRHDMFDNSVAMIPISLLLLALEFACAREPHLTAAVLCEPTLSLRSLIVRDIEVSQSVSCSPLPFSAAMELDSQPGSRIANKSAIC
jgi:hypothetical protein